MSTARLDFEGRLEGDVEAGVVEDGKRLRSNRATRDGVLKGSITMQSRNGMNTALDKALVLASAICRLVLA